MSIKHNKELGHKIDEATSQLTFLEENIDNILVGISQKSYDNTQDLFAKAEKLVSDLDDSLADMKYHLDKMEEDFAEAEKLLKGMQK